MSGLTIISGHTTPSKGGRAYANGLTLQGVTTNPKLVVRWKSCGCVCCGVREAAVDDEMVCAKVFARTVISYRLGVPMLGVPRLDVTREEKGRLFHLRSSFRNTAGSGCGRVTNPAGIVCAGEYVTVCDIKWSSGTLGDSGLVRARTAQKYLARGGL